MLYIFSIPSDPVMHNRWVQIIRKSRRDDCWNPSKSTVICSDHFRAKDLYFSKNQKRRRLKHDAVPSKVIEHSFFFIKRNTTKCACR